MPNYVTNVLTVAPEIAAAITRPATDDEAARVDFSLVIPEPDNIERGYCTGSHEEGVICWYSWKTLAWGTKWNAADSSFTPAPGDLVIVRFDTAWSHPDPVIIKLSQMFPDEPIRVEYADEDLGSNLGAYVIKNGTITERQDIVEGSVDAEEWACRLIWDQTLEEFNAE